MLVAFFILTDYINQCMAQAIYDRLEDGTFAGRIPACTGVVAFGRTLRECETELRSTLEDWILLGLKLKHPLPVINEINLNQEPRYESVGSL
ncbi:MAG: type II toxin-antitoxin system HicB family antitoxin [Bacillota bacterium]